MEQIFDMEDTVICLYLEALQERKQNQNNGLQGNINIRSIR